MNSESPVIIMAGGTGGHIFPALAVAEQIRRRSVPVVWLGSKGGMETRIVPQYDIPLVAIAVRGLRGKGALTRLLAPFKLSYAVIEALRAMIKLKPRAVLGLGGFASGPGGLAAWLLGKPLYVHEQNAIPGMTNRWLSHLARVVMEGFPGSLSSISKAPAVFTGNPLREAFAQIDDAGQRLAQRSGPVRLLVLGGSLGALKLNETVPAAVASPVVDQELEIWHQCGEKHLDVTREAYRTAEVQACVEPFISDMATAYAWADLVIARAGALTVSELTQVGVAAILVPYPHAVDDHQTVNAAALVQRGAARLLPDQDVAPETLAEQLQQLVTDRDVLLEMAVASAELRKPAAAEEVAKICLGELEKAQPEVMT